MAVTIEQNPSLYQPVYNEVVYILSSTQTAQTSFKYLADIYIAGSVDYVRLRVAIEPDGAKGIIKVGEEIQDYLTQNIGDPAGVVGTTANPESIIDYVVKFGEEYEVAGVLTQYPDLTIDSSRYVFNGSLEEYDFTTWDYTDWFLDGVTKKFLTNSPSTIDTMADNSGWLYFLHGAVTPIAYFRVQTFDSNGSAIGTWDITNTLTAFATTGEFLGKVTASPVTINALPNSEFTSGVQPVFTGVEGSYTIQAFSGVPSKISELKTFNIVDPCKFERWNILFQSRMGGYDPFTFALLSRDADEIKKEYYKKDPTRLSGVTYSWSLSDKTDVQFFTKSKRTRTLNSDWNSEEIQDWLEELVSSPNVYLEDDSNNLIPVTIQNTSFEFKKKVNEKLFNLSIRVGMADNYRQRG